MHHTGTHPSLSSQTALLHFSSGSSCSGGTAARYLDACKAKTRLNLRVPTAPRPRERSAASYMWSCGFLVRRVWSGGSPRRPAAGSMLSRTASPSSPCSFHQSCNNTANSDIFAAMQVSSRCYWLNHSILHFWDQKCRKTDLLGSSTNPSGSHEGGKSNVRPCFFLSVLFPLLFIVAVLLVLLFSWWLSKHDSIFILLNQRTTEK